MIQVGRGADLPRETLHAKRFSEVGPEDLDGDFPLIPEVAGEVQEGASPVVGQCGTTT